MLLAHIQNDLAVLKKTAAEAQRVASSEAESLRGQVNSQIIRIAHLDATKSFLQGKEPL